MRHSAETREKIRRSKIGPLNPMFGKTISHETKAKISASLTGKKYKKWSEEARHRISLNRKGRPSANKGNRYKLNLNEEQKARRSEIARARKDSDETRAKKRAWHIAHPNLIRSDTSIELAVQDELANRQILFVKQFQIEGVAIVDFYLPEWNIVIQCDGCYWHNCLEHYPTHHQKQRLKDRTKDAKLEMRGFRVCRFWEHDIKVSARDCINTLEID